MHFMQRWNGENTHIRGVRSFGLLPHTNGFTAKFITIDTTGLWAMMARVEPETPPDRKVLADRDGWWRKLFAPKKVVSDKGNRRRQFGYMIRRMARRST